MSAFNTCAARKARVADIITIAGKLSTAAPREITGPSRAQQIIRVRQAVYIVARRAGHSYPEIGRRMNRDHSSVMTGIRTAEAIIARSDDYSAFVADLERQVLSSGAFIA